MASKKIQVTFELTTEKEWREFILRPGLIVVDLYRDWAGPCVAMSTPLKALKTSEVAFEWMHLASAPSSIVPDLKRLEGSRPTFVLLSGRRLVNVIFGCNAPEVIRIISDEIEREKRAAEGLEKRQTVSLTRLSPAELAREDLLLGSEGERLRAERNQAELEADRVLRCILGQIAEHLPATTVVVVFPYALQSDACEDILGSLRQSWREMGFAVTREEQVELTREAVDLMFWERRLPQHDVLTESVMEGASLVLMLERQADEEDAQDEQEGSEDAYALDVEPAIAKSIYGFLPGTGSSMELITPAESATPGFREEEDVDLEYEEDLEADEDLETAEEGGEEREAGGEQGEDEGEGEETAEDEGVEEAQHGEDQEATEEANEEAEGGEAEGGEDEGGEDEGGEATSGQDQGGQAEEADEGFGDVEEEDNAEVVLPMERPSDDGDDEGDEDEDLIPQVPVRVWNPRELLPALDSAAARLLFRRDEGPGPVLPGIWTPLTALSKAAAVKALFEDVAEPLYEPPTPPPPPPPETTVICFAGDKRDEVLGLAENFPSEVTRSGFFTKGRKLLASSRPDYERLVRSGLQAAKTLVVLEVTRVRSTPLLELATAGPLYVSATPGVAKADVDEFFGAKVVRANQDDLREIVKAQDNEGEGGVQPKDPAPAPAPAKARTEGDGEEGDEAGEGGGQAEGEDEGEGEGETAAGPGGAEAEAAGGPQVAVGQGLGDGEGVLEDGADAAGAAAAEAMAEATAADADAEEQLLAGSGEGDAPPTAPVEADEGAPPAEE